MGNVRPDKGVFKRKGSDVWQHRIFIPADLREHYGDRSLLPARSLGTKDLAEANRRARLRAAEYEKEFAEKRQLRSETAVAAAGKRTLSPQTIERIAAKHGRRKARHRFRTQGRNIRQGKG